MTTLDPRWLFTPEQIGKTPSIRQGMSKKQEILNRQNAAGWIRRIGKKVFEFCKKPSSLSTSTAMVFMHRFYMFHSFQKFPPLKMAPCCLFLAAKVEETPLKLEYVIKTVHMISSENAEKLETTDKEYKRLQQELIENENLLLQTLGFDLVIVHPHTSIITSSKTTGVPEALTKMAYNLATNSLHFTTMCLTYEPAKVACVCIHLASKRSTLDIGKSFEGRYWWSYLDPEVDMETIERITMEYVAVIEHCKAAFNKWMQQGNNSGNKRIRLEQ